MDLVSGCPFWPINRGLLATYPTLHESVDADVVVIGAGITGAFTAHALQAAGLATVVLDKRDAGFGSTAASTGLLQYEVDTPLAELIRLHGEAAAVRGYRACHTALQKIEKIARRVKADFKWRGSFYGANRLRDIPGLRRECALRQRHGFSAELWERPTIASQCDLPYKAAIISTAAAEVDAYQFAHALLADATRRGARVFDRTEVVAQRLTSRGVELRTRNNCRVRAKYLVIAPGYEANPFLPEPVMALHSTYALITEPLKEIPGWPARRLIWETARPYLYLRTTDDNRIVIGGGDVPFRDPHQRDQLLRSKVTSLKRRLDHLLPQIKADVAYSWTGTFAETEDGLPYIGQLKNYPRTWFALGYGGNGIIFSQIASEIIRDGCLGATHANADLFRFGRGSK